MSDCEYYSAGNDVRKEWVDPIVPPGFEADDFGLGSTPAGVHLLACGRIELQNRTFDEVAYFRSYFSANVLNGTWGSNLTAVNPDVVVDDAGLQARLAALDVPARLGTIERVNVVDGLPATEWRIRWDGFEVSLGHETITTQLLTSNLDAADWTVDQSAHRFDWKGRIEGTSLTDVGGALLRFSGDSKVGQMFGGNAAYPVSVGKYRTAALEVLISEAYDAET